MQDFEGDVGPGTTRTDLITVSPVAAAGTASAPATLTLNENASSVAITGVSVGPLAEDSDDTVSAVLTVGHGKLHVSNTGLPAGVTVTGDDSGSLTVAGSAALVNTVLAGLTYTVATEYEGSDTLHVTVTSIDGSNTSVTQGTASTAITVNPVAEAGTASAPATLTLNENASSVAITGVSVGPLAEDSDDTVSAVLTVGHGKLHVSNTGLPAGVTVTGDDSGSLTVAGSAALVNTVLAGLTYTVATEYEGSDTLHVTVTSIDGSNTSVTQGTASTAITVNPVAEPASLAGTVTSVSGLSDTPIPLTIVATPFDSDDILSIQITGVPSDAVLTYVDASHVTHTLTPVGGVYTLTPAQLNELKFIADEEDQTVLHVVVTSSEGTSSVKSSVDIAVTVDSVFEIKAGDTFHMNGDTLTDHTVTVNGTLIGFGTVTGSGGILDSINIGPSGLIEASSSHSLDLNGNITGSGTLELTNNTTMEIGGSVASSVKVFFDIGAGSTGELKLDDPVHFHAPITGFGGSDIIDLHNSNFAYLGTGPTLLNSSHLTATLGSGGSTETISLVSMTSSETVITVSEGGTTATINLEGNYTGHSFTFSSDGSGGTQFVDPLAIYSGATLELPGASADNVLFINNAEISGTLVLDNATAFTGQISGFTGTSAQSDAIDLKGITFNSETTWTYTANSAGTGGALTISEGATVVDTLNFAGNYTAANFTVQSDGNGGTLISDPPTSSPVVNSVIMQDPGPAASSTIVATAPNQTLTGLAASDTFVFNFATVGQTTVTDFHPNSDALQFKSPIFADALAALNAAQDDGHGNTVIAIDAHDSITLSGVLKAQLHAADFHVV